MHFQTKKQSDLSPAFFDYLRYFDILGFNLLSFPLLRSLPDLRSGIYEVYENCRLSIPKRRPPLSDSVLVMAKIACCLKNFFVQILPWQVNRSPKEAWLLVQGMDRWLQIHYLIYN